MKSAVLNVTLSVSITIALLAGCDGPQSQFGGAPQSAVTALANHSAAWMLPEAKNEDLLYIANIAGSSDYKGSITVYTYPQGKLVGEIKGFSRPNGLCLDKAGDVYVANFGAENIIEYAHGGTKQLPSSAIMGLRMDVPLTRQPATSPSRTGATARSDRAIQTARCSSTSKPGARPRF
jgi:hypothetical protein